MMKKTICLLLATLPLVGFAQNTWEVPQDQKALAASAQIKAAKAEKHSPKTDPKYLAGAVPLVQGDVVFELDRDVPGMSAAEIYAKAYDTVGTIVDDSKEDGLTPASRIAVVNKSEHTFAAKMKEWLVFSKNVISLDRTIFNYTLIVKATDGHIHVAMERMGYEYETDRGKQGLKVMAKDWITDKMALNKRKDKVSYRSGKFRMKTIDRKDNVFMRICNALNIKY